MPLSTPWSPAIDVAGVHHQGACFPTWVARTPLLCASPPSEANKQVFAIRTFIALCFFSYLLSCAASYTPNGYCIPAVLVCSPVDCSMTCRTSPRGCACSRGARGLAVCPYSFSSRLSVSESYTPCGYCILTVLVCGPVDRSMTDGTSPERGVPAVGELLEIRPVCIHLSLSGFRLCPPFLF